MKKSRKKLQEEERRRQLIREEEQPGRLKKKTIKELIAPGAYIALITCAGTWTYNCVNGQGWIAVALVIFASWSPYKAIVGSLVFGALSILRLYIPLNIPTALFSMLPFLVTAVVLVVSSIRMSRENAQPKGCGVNYFREER